MDADSIPRPTPGSPLYIAGFTPVSTHWCDRFFSPLGAVRPGFKGLAGSGGSMILAPGSGEAIALKRSSGQSMTEYVLTIAVIAIAVVWAAYAFYDPFNNGLSQWAGYFAGFFGDSSIF